ncbi:hypothetical protein PHYBLDRAFT_138838 [Phycomyces blakesleeanus NRRL 1555(-)]|uniref:Uncharacterized protein n=1 Tax=Phycomyces blakesleeanus (strain ATCC 8743b / DSM 1359 / FGSC 10004 / NBRC 33097 / NRRL 1555) TaxID=763407 RepID=A0A163ESI9_PHYB8|nr:hypothetical protein PHYBLDRAFT_138838 [Phycomyces blakesleeanus NRRL 1555(-)]OAD81290.1 hypothetical protein PHYBLDRAFT_138838 [Phycomyces blakesleeanus NRRL 1555(-)]|eukprot:XP_018299330.1 hypothetical protein PHYBLDRAFT_138838 [Phycomyces blakesleeanus NRRL 1555(-)]
MAIQIIPDECSSAKHAMNQEPLSLGVVIDMVISTLHKMMGLQYSFNKELPIAQNREVQVVDQSEESALAQNRLRALEFVQRHNSLINKIAQAVGERNAMARDTASGMNITSQILEDCLSSLKESGVAPQQKYRKQ